MLAAGDFLLLGAGPILWVISTRPAPSGHARPRCSGGCRRSTSLPTARGIGTVSVPWWAACGAEACLYVASLGFFAQMVVICLSPAVGLLRQPEMVREVATQRA